MKYTAQQTAEHLRLLALAFYQAMNESPDEGDGLGLDGKRPFGNSGIAGDVLEIIEEEPEDLEGGFKVWSDSQYEYAKELFNVKLGPYLVKHGKKYFTSLSTS
jgi:hypothetical protein